MHQARNNHEQHTDGDDGCAAEAREGFLGIENASDEKHADGSEKYDVAAPFREQEDAEHGEHGDNSNPRM